MSVKAGARFGGFRLQLVWGSRLILMSFNWG